MAPTLYDEDIPLSSDFIAEWDPLMLQFLSPVDPPEPPMPAPRTRPRITAVVDAPAIPPIPRPPAASTNDVILTWLNRLPPPNLNSFNEHQSIFDTANNLASTISDEYGSYEGPHSVFEEGDEEFSQADRDQQDDYIAGLRDHARRLLEQCDRWTTFNIPPPPSADNLTISHSIEELRGSLATLIETGAVLEVTPASITYLIPGRTFVEGPMAIPLGPWKLTVNIGAITNNFQPKYLLSIDRGPNWLNPDLPASYLHPHVNTGGSFCLGAAEELLRASIYRDPDPVRLYDALCAWAWTYNARSPFIRLHDFQQYLFPPDRNLTPARLITAEPLIGDDYATLTPRTGQGPVPPPDDETPSRPRRQPTPAPAVEAPRRPSIRVVPNTTATLPPGTLDDHLATVNLPSLAVRNPRISVVGEGEAAPDNPGGPAPVPVPATLIDPTPLTFELVHDPATDRPRYRVRRPGSANNPGI